MNRFTEGFKKFFDPLSTAQRAMFIGLTVIIIAFVGTLFFWALKPDYALLFGSLQSDAAQQIVKKLDDEGVKYKLQDNGHTIYVQSDKVDELRIKLAPVGVSQSDVKGYELFDSNALGMTDFMQQLNNKRALEGELVRSINSLKQVKSSRIHLVLPERTPFKETSVKASASVILNLKQGQSLDKKQIDGITSLIAGSVEGLSKSNVTVIDQIGNRLTNGNNSTSEFASGNLQIQLRQKTESYLTQRGQTMLDRVLGPANSILRVSVEQDFDSLVRKSDKIDPDSRTIISEERSNEVHKDEGRKPVPVDEFTPLDKRSESVVVSTKDNQSTSQTRNYEVNKTKEVFKKAQGKIKRLTASVLINYKHEIKKDSLGNLAKVSQPYSSDEIAGFRDAIGMALGIQPERGDQLTIKQIEFYDPTKIDDQSNFLDQPTPWNEILRWSLIILTFLAIVALIYSIRKRIGSGEQIMLGFHDGPMENVLLADDGSNKLDTGKQENKGEGDDKSSGDEPAQLEEKIFTMDEIKGFVEEKPSEAAKVMRAMMASNENGK